MELILLILAIAVIAKLRQHGRRIATLDDQLKSLRIDFELLARYAAPQAPLAREDASATVEEAAPAVPDDRRAAAPDEIAAGEPLLPPATNDPSIEPIPAPAPEPALARTRDDIVETLGSRWAVWVGGLALALGGIFLVRYSIDAGFFGPRVRLALAAAFGIALAAASEVTRRRGFDRVLPAVPSAHVPAILAAAASVVLFGTAYAAHGIYGFIGATPAFTLLGAIAIATILAARLHNVAVAGAGLIGAYLTPALVSSQSAEPVILFVYLAAVLGASVMVARIGRWAGLAAAAYGGAALWSLAYLLFATGAVDPLPPTLLHLAGLALFVAVWSPRMAGPPAAIERTVTLACGIGIAFVSLALADDGGSPALAPVLLAAMIASAAMQAKALLLLHVAGVAIILLQRDFIAPLAILSSQDPSLPLWTPSADRARAFAPYAMVLGGVTLALGLSLARRNVARRPLHAVSWAAWSGVVPIVVVATTWLLFRTVQGDLPYAAGAAVLSLLLAGGAEWTGRRENPAQAGGAAVSAFCLGAGASFALAVTIGFGPLGATIAMGVCALIPAVATRLRRWPVLGWLSAAFAATTLALVSLDPTIVGRANLSARPLLNELLPAYFLPATCFAAAAWQLARTTAGRPQLAHQAFAALFALVGAGMLARHAMNGGVIDASEPRLAEQAIYTLILIGGGGILFVLDRKSPSVVFRQGSIGLGIVSLASIALTHLLYLNPLTTFDRLGANPVFDLLLLAYALPALALAGLSYAMHGHRPPAYVASLATTSGLLGFAYVTLRVRRAFHGEYIGWDGRMGELEAYTYSAVWLLLGVGLLVVDRWVGSLRLRVASAALLVLTVAKVFLFDMRHLEGILRPLSFIGLGIVLIAIGMFYQRVLFRRVSKKQPIQTDE